MKETPFVMLVEDDQDDVDVTLLAFARAGLSDVVVARDGVEALEKLARGRALPRVIFLDLKLPGLDGIEVLRRVRTDERTALLPIVVLTSSIEPSDLDAAYRAGANSYVRKAIDPDHFDGLVEQLGRYWLAVNEVAA